MCELRGMAGIRGPLAAQDAVRWGVGKDGAVLQRLRCPHWPGCLALGTSLEPSAGSRGVLALSMPS